MSEMRPNFCPSANARSGPQADCPVLGNLPARRPFGNLVAFRFIPLSRNLSQHFQVIAQEVGPDRQKKPGRQMDCLGVNAQTILHRRSRNAWHLCRSVSLKARTTRRALPLWGKFMRHDLASCMGPLHQMMRQYENSLVQPASLPKLSYPELCTIGLVQDCVTRISRKRLLRSSIAIWLHGRAQGRQHEQIARRASLAFAETGRSDEKSRTSGQGPFARTYLLSHLEPRTNGANGSSCLLAPFLESLNGAQHHGRNYMPPACHRKLRSLLSLNLHGLSDQHIVE